MKPCLLAILLLSFHQLAFSQQSDFIVIKKKNNKTVKTYHEGAFLAAVTWDDFQINGFIKEIRNDSIILVQQEKRMMGTDFGMELDTFYYTIAIDYHQIKRWHFTGNYHWGNKRGFIQVALPKILMIGGAGYIALELINSAYRKESLNEGNKLTTLGIAAGAVVAGFIWNRMNNMSDSKANKKYKVVYVKAGQIKLNSR